MLINLGGLCNFLHSCIFFYTSIGTCISPISRLITFLDFWVVYRKEKDIPLVGLECTPLSSWRLGPIRSQLGT